MVTWNLHTPSTHYAKLARAVKFKLDTIAEHANNQSRETANTLDTRATLFAVSDQHQHGNQTELNNSIGTFAAESAQPTAILRFC